MSTEPTMTTKTPKQAESADWMVFALHDKAADERKYVLAKGEEAARFGLGGKWYDAESTMPCEQHEITELPRLIEAALEAENAAHTALRAADPALRAADHLDGRLRVSEGASARFRALEAEYERRKAERLELARVMLDADVLARAESEHD